MAFRSVLVSACCAFACSGLASARTMGDLQGLQSTGGRHLHAHIDQAELSHIGRGLRADDTPYTYGEGVKDWGGICQQGDKITQSPINIPQAKVDEAKAMPTGALSFNYANFTGATAVNTGHGVQVNMPEGNILTVGEQKWQLLQFHFHTPSEHALADRFSAMEAHLVHSNVATGDLAVIGVLLNPLGSRLRDGYSSALEQALDKVPAELKAESDPFTLNVDTFASMLSPVGAIPTGEMVGSGSAPIVNYSGSLTTPPCTAGLQWYVVMKESPVGPSQVVAFSSLLGNGTTLDQNRRPLQPSLDRELSVDFA